MLPAVGANLGQSKNIAKKPEQSSRPITRRMTAAAAAALRPPEMVAVNVRDKRAAARAEKDLSGASIKAHQVFRQEQSYEGGRNRAGKPHGQGKKIYENGDFADGKWVNGVFKAGTVKWTDLDEEWGKGVYEGQMVDNMYCGLGEFTYADGDFEKGIWKDNQLISGTVRLVTPDGGVYEGQVEHGNYHGEGRLTSRNGDYYAGLFEYNRFMQGTGRVTDEYGDVYEGEMKEKMRHGKGTVFKSNGDVIKGVFENDKLISSESNAAKTS